ncbi:MAG: hypothetical protein R3Y33_00430 [Clostridia bacterium]
MKTFIIEVLYPEFNNLYGDTGNILYLTKKLEKSPLKIKVINTFFSETPAFTSEKVDFLFIAPSSEKNQIKQIDKLKKYKTELKERIESGLITLATGNALEIFGEYIILPDESKCEALGIFPIYAKRFDKLRYNDLSLGKYKDIDIVGYKNQLSHSYLTGDFDKEFLQMTRGSGFNPDVKTEGINVNNFFASYLLGPILPINPIFTEEILKNYLGDDYIQNDLPFEKEAYKQRLSELKSVN